jgi:hypothetical protein
MRVDDRTNTTDNKGLIKIKFSHLVPVRKFHFEVDKGPVRQSHVK